MKMSIIFEHVMALILNLSRSLYNKISECKISIDYKSWRKKGCPTPPPQQAKRYAIEKIQLQYKYNIFIETGTYRGDMIYYQHKFFKNVYSIELSSYYYKRAKKRFANDTNVHLLMGDSGKILHEIVDKIKEPALFWLDGHYSGGLTAQGASDCPIYEELNAILSSKHKHIIFIDDARCFGTDKSYPSIDELKSYLRKQNREYTFYIDNDAIQIILN